jgi:hypothetical protein
MIRDLTGRCEKKSFNPGLDKVSVSTMLRSGTYPWNPTY